jgi:hypothetical protein
MGERSYNCTLALQKHSIKYHMERRTDEQELFIENAGLVLLWPYLCAYFIKLGVINGRTFTSQEAQHRSVYLLQYMVDGSEANVNDVLALNKVLCNLPLDEPLIMATPLSDWEKEVSDSILKDIIYRWTILGETSVPGLQQTFMKRNAKMIRHENHWSIVVEKGNCDMLLDYIPWSITNIATSWMDFHVNVKWR